MTKKQLEERIDVLEKELVELKSQLLSLALRPAVAYPVYIPTPPPLPQPIYIQPRIFPSWPPPSYPIITCQAGRNTMES